MRRRLLAVPLALATAAVVPPALAEDTATTPTGPEVQSYAGSFVAPTRFTDGTGGWPGLGRKVYLAAEAADGVIADVFPVDQRAWGGAFQLTDVADATGSGNLDVFFYGHLASVADGTPETLSEHQTADRGEKGFVPAGTRFAVVFSADAVRPTFTFRASERPVVGLTALDGVTLPAGATLGIRNDTADYAALRHDSTKPLVNRSGTGNGLRVGEVVDVTFTKAGTYSFVSSVGTSTVTVTQ